jgi:hypothetical protein
MSEKKREDEVEVQTFLSRYHVNMGLTTVRVEVPAGK